MMEYGGDSRFNSLEIIEDEAMVCETVIMNIKKLSSEHWSLKNPPPDFNHDAVGSPAMQF